MLVTPQGFASIGPKAQGAPVALLRTRPLVFSGKGTAPTLFINAVGAENISFAVLDPITGQPLDGLDHHSYTGGVQGVSDSERLEVRWASQSRFCFGPSGEVKVWGGSGLLESSLVEVAYQWQ